jgi:hypothetical protein
MIIDARSQHDLIAALNLRSFFDAAHLSGRTGSESPRSARPDLARQAGDVRSSANLAVWEEYLPADCIAAMVSSGWDRST